MNVEIQSENKQKWKIFIWEYKSMFPKALKETVKIKRNDDSVFLRRKSALTQKWKSLQNYREVAYQL